MKGTRQKKTERKIPEWLCMRNFILGYLILCCLILFSATHDRIMYLKNEGIPKGGTVRTNRKKLDVCM